MTIILELVIIEFLKFRILNNLNFPLLPYYMYMYILNVCMAASLQNFGNALLTGHSVIDNLLDVLKNSVNQSYQVLQHFPIMHITKYYWSGQSILE